MKVAAFEAKVINPIFNPETGEVEGYRITDGKRPSFWMIVSAHMVKKKML